jgi:hypothetical protein
LADFIPPPPPHDLTDALAAWGRLKARPERKARLFQYKLHVDFLFCALRSYPVSLWTRAQSKYPHLPHLIARIEAPFSFPSWRSAIPGFLMAVFMTIFALTLEPEKGTELFKSWQTISSVALVFFGTLSVKWQAGNQIDADEYLSISAFLLYGTIFAAVWGYFASASRANPIYSGLFLFSFAVTLSMINLLTVHYLLSLFYRGIQLRTNS